MGIDCFKSSWRTSLGRFRHIALPTNHGFKLTLGTTRYNPRLPLGRKKHTLTKGQYHPFAAKRWRCPAVLPQATRNLDHPELSTCRGANPEPFLSPLRRLPPPRKKQTPKPQSSGQVAGPRPLAVSQERLLGPVRPRPVDSDYSSSHCLCPNFRGFQICVCVCVCVSLQVFVVCG